MKVHRFITTNKWNILVTEEKYSASNSSSENTMYEFVYVLDPDQTLFNNDKKRERWKWLIRND